MPRCRFCWYQSPMARRVRRNRFAAVLRPIVLPRFAPVMSKSQEVKRARFVRSLTARTASVRPSKRHQPRLLRVEFQSVFLEALENDPIDSLRISSMRETDHQIIGKSHRENLALHPFLQHFRKPAVEYFMQVDVGQNW